MEFQLYTIYDKTAEECGPLFEAKSHPVAIRATKELLKDTPYPEDFKLLHVGFVNKTTGVISSFTPHLEVDIWSLDYSLVEDKEQ